MLEIENLGLVEMNSQEVQEVDGGIVPPFPGGLFMAGREVGSFMWGYVNGFLDNLK